MCNITDFVFEGGNKKHICISKDNVAYWGEKSKDNIAFSKSTLKTSLKYLIQTCYFMVINPLQKTGIPMGIDPALSWANLFLYTKNEYMSELISSDKVKARHFHANKRFIDDLGTLNDGVVFSDVYKEIYPPDLSLLSNFLKAVFHKFYLVSSWIPWTICRYEFKERFFDSKTHH